MTTRRCLSLLCLVALAMPCTGCAFAPDRWTVGYKTEEDPRTHRRIEQEVGASISGPIPALTP